MLVVLQARWTRRWCWWTSRPRDTAASASSPSRTRRRWTECARSTSTPSRTRRWHGHDAWCELRLTRLLQVECKKAQPKEVVQAANTAALLGKRVILSNLGLLPQLALGQGGAQSAAVAAAGHPAVAAVGAAGQQQPQLGHGAQLQAALQHQLAASAALGGYLLYLLTIHLTADCCLNFYSLFSAPLCSVQMQISRHQADPRVCRELRQAAGRGGGGASLHVGPPLLALPPALRSWRGRTPARLPAGRSWGGSWGGSWRGAVHRGQPAHVAALRRAARRPPHLRALAAAAAPGRGHRGGGSRRTQPRRADITR